MSLCMFGLFIADKIKTYNVKRRFKIYKFTKFTLQN